MFTAFLLVCETFHYSCGKIEFGVNFIMKQLLKRFRKRKLLIDDEYFSGI